MSYPFNPEYQGLLPDNELEDFGYYNQQVRVPSLAVATTKPRTKAQARRGIGAPSGSNLSLVAKQSSAMKGSPKKSKAELKAFYDNVMASRQFEHHQQMIPEVTLEKQTMTIRAQGPPKKRPAYYQQYVEQMPHEEEMQQQMHMVPHVPQKQVVQQNQPFVGAMGQNFPRAPQPQQMPAAVGGAFMGANMSAGGSITNTVIIQQPARLLSATCSKCHEVFEGHDADRKLKQHEKNCGKLKCPICKKFYVNKITLTDHIFKFHSA